MVGVSRGAVAGGETPLDYDHPADLVADGVLYERLGVGEDGVAFYAADSACSVLLTSVDADGQRGRVERVPADALAALLDPIEWRETDGALLARVGGASA